MLTWPTRGRWKGLARKYGHAPRSSGFIGQTGYRPGGRWLYPTLHKNLDSYVDEFEAHFDKTLRENFGR